MENQVKETGCCPIFDPAPWDEQDIIWKDKLFIKDTIPQFLHMPLPGVFAKAVGRMWKKIEDAGTKPEMKDFLMLAYDPSPWKSELYINTTKEITGADNIQLTGTYIAKVFDGPFNAVPKWIKEIEKFVSAKGKKIKKLYFYYTTCPKCAKVYGHNYVVVFAEV